MYEDFAYVYDYLMKDVDYDRWFDYIHQILKINNVTPKNVLELACGTGNMSIRLAERGFEVTAIDISADMLNVAQHKADDHGVDIQFIHQDITQFEVHRCFDLVLCLCDSVNYILETEKMSQLFKRVRNKLSENGIFIFDINSRYKLKNIIGCNTFAESGDEVSYIWENYFDEIKNQCEFYLTFFIKKGDYYVRKEEIHYQRAYGVNEILSLLKQQGFEFVTMYDDFSFNYPNYKSHRINFVCKK